MTTKEFNYNLFEYFGDLRYEKLWFHATAYYVIVCGDLQVCKSEILLNIQQTGKVKNELALREILNDLDLDWEF